VDVLPLTVGQFMDIAEMSVHVTISDQ